MFQRKRKTSTLFPRVLLLFCGGTISMHKDEKTGALNIAHGADQFFKLEPRIAEIASIATHFVANIDSTNIAHTQWKQLASLIQKNYKTYDGFVITMGTNTLAYASSALSFALKGIGKPVVFTGAQIPAEVISTDGRNNLVNALRVCTMDIAGVYVVFGSKIILGCRAKKMSESELDAFKTFNDRDIGEISIGINFHKEVPHRHRNAFRVRNGFNPNIVSLTLVPGLSGVYVKTIIDAGVEGIVLRAFGSGDIPHDLIPALEYAQAKKIPVVVTTQCPGGATIMGLNEPGLRALKTGVIQAFDMSMETMTTKLMWLLHQGFSYQKIQEKMYKNLCGEVDMRRMRFFFTQELRDIGSTAK